MWLPKCLPSLVYGDPRQLKSSNGRPFLSLQNNYVNGYTIFFVRTFAKLRNETISFDTTVCMSFSSPWNNSAPTGWIFMKIDIWGFFGKFVEKIQVSLKSDRNEKYFTRRPIHFFLSYLAHFFLEREMFQIKNYRENQNTHFMFSNFFPRKSYR
jgi:hypothetical protein